MFDFARIKRGLSILYVKKLGYDVLLKPRLYESTAKMAENNSLFIFLLRLKSYRVLR